MKILMVAPKQFFEPRGTLFSVLGRLKALSALGHEIDLVTYSYWGGRTNSTRRDSSNSFDIFREENFHWFVTDEIVPWLMKTIKMLFRSRYDLFHTHEEASFIGFILAKLFRIRHLYDMHSSSPQQLVNFPYSKFGPLIRLFRWLEETVIHSSHAVITICPGLKEQVE